MDSTLANNSLTRRGLSGNAIKLLAMSAMLLEHISVFFTKAPALFWCMRFLGKAAAPIFFYFIVEGYRHTHNKNRYTLNLAVFSIISYVPFILCFDSAINADTFLNFSIIYNLLIGLLVIRASHEIKNRILRWSLIAVLFLLSCFGDWGWVAPLTILIFDLYHENRKNQIYAYTLFTLIRTGLLTKILSPMLFFARWKTGFDFTEWGYFGYDFGTLIPVVILLLYNGEKGRGGEIAKWGFYVFYPLHLLIIAILKMYLV